MTQRWLILLLLFCLSPFHAASESNPAPVNVLLLHSYQNEAKGFVPFFEGIQNAFISDTAVSADFFTEHMDTSRFPGYAYLQHLSEYYKTKYQNTRIDIIITYASPALDFLLQYGDDIFPGIPVVFGLVSESLIEKRTFPENYTGILSGPQFEPTLDAALKMLPDTKMVLVVGGISTVDVQYMSVAKNQLKPFREKVRIEYINQLGMEDLLTFTANLPKNSIIIYSILHMDAKGAVYGPQEAASLIAEKANAPVFGISQTHFGTGLTGGFLTSTYLVGRKSALAAVDILNGKKQTEFTTYSEDTSAFYFDWRQLRRWGIDEKTLPAGSELLYREFTAWEQFRKQIITVLILFAVETLLIGGLLLNRNQRISMQKNLQKSERLWKTVLEILPVGVSITDRHGEIIHENTAKRQIWSGTGDTKPDFPFERKARRIAADEQIHPDESALTKAVSHGESTFEEELEIECLDGSHRFILNWAIPILGIENQIEGAVEINSDITAREQAKKQIAHSLQEKETLLRELYHRTKNNMQVISSLLMLHGANTPNEEVKHIVRDIDNKIQSMSLVHQKLYQSKNLSKIKLQEYLQELSELLFKSHSNTSGNISITTEIEPVSVTIDAAIPCGLILNELMSNTFKHGFSEDESGSISIIISRGEDGNIELYYSDTGKGTPEDFDFRNTSSLGLKTIFALGEHQLNGKVTFSNNRGLHCHISITDTFNQRV